MNGLAFASCARCVGSSLIDKFSEAFFFLSSPEFYGYVPFFTVRSHVPTFPSFLYSPSYRGSAPHTLPFYCGAAHVVYYRSWLSFVQSSRHLGACMKYSCSTVKYVNSLPWIEEYMVSLFILFYFAPDGMS